MAYFSRSYRTTRDGLTRYGFTRLGARLGLLCIQSQSTPEKGEALKEGSRYNVIMYTELPITTESRLLYGLVAREMNYVMLFYEVFFAVR
jgi:hypothetical protein